MPSESKGRLTPKDTRITVRISSKHLSCFIFIMMLFGLITRLAVGLYVVHTFDLDYYFDWATGLHEGFFNAYDHVRRLDYPPVILFLLYPIGFLLKTPYSANDPAIAAFCLKLVQITADTVLIPAIYFALRKYSPSLSAAMACLWAVSPAAIVNSAFWGQTDGLMLLLLLLAFTSLDAGHPTASAVLYTVACLTKFQCLYFAPVFLLFFFTRFRPKKFFPAIGWAVGTALIIFAPFMAESGWKLPFRIYFGGHGKYPYAVLNAFNLYGLLGINYYFDDRTPLLGPVSLNHISLLLTVLIVLGIVILFFRAKDQCPYLLCYLLMQGIFLLTTRQHERYQIPVLIFLIAAAVKHKSIRLFFVYILQSVIIFVNQFLLLTRVISPYPLEWLRENERILQPVFSLLNIVLALFGLVFALEILLGRESRLIGFLTKEREPLKNETNES